MTTTEAPTARPVFARRTIGATGEARCIGCDLTWTGDCAIATSTRHSRLTGHITRAKYTTEYEYAPQ
jgi:hypothetical protein